MASEAFTHLDDRLTTYESRLTGVETEIKNLGVQLSDISMQLRRLGEQTQTDWGVLARWAGVVVLFVSTLGTLAFMPLKGTVDRLDMILTHHLECDGHQASSTRIASLERCLVEVNQRFDREESEQRERIGLVYRELNRINAQLGYDLPPPKESPP